MANTSILNAFDRFWQHVVALVGNKADKDEVVDLTSDQLVSGVKTFENGIKIGDGLLYKTTDGFVISFEEEV